MYIVLFIHFFFLFSGNRHASVRIFSPLPKYSVTRTVLLKDDVALQAGYQQKDAFTCANHVKKSYKRFSFCQFLLNIIPVLKWLPEYSFKNNLAGDITAGITVAVMHIPQGEHYKYCEWKLISVHIHSSNSFQNRSIFFLFNSCSLLLYAKVWPMDYWLVWRLVRVCIWRSFRQSFTSCSAHRVTYRSARCPLSVWWHWRWCKRTHTAMECPSQIHPQMQRQRRR